MNENLGQDLLDKFKEFAEAIEQAGERLAQDAADSMWANLQQDEALLIKLMDSLPPKSGPYPTPNDPGNIEYGWALYFLNNDLPKEKAGKYIYDLLKLVGMPNSNISTATWDSWWKIWESSGVTMGDGSLIATQWYAVMDSGWSLALIDFMMFYLGLRKKAPFNNNPNAMTIPASQPTLRIAVMGDWGTGNYKDGPSPNSPSYQVMSAIKSMAPDMIMHLGDVYYAGTSSEEQGNLINVWQYDAPQGNFTLNSNHEMYDGAEAYYATALASSLFAKWHTGPNGSAPTSYFSIEYGDYLILGLDSAYNATGMYMQGRITDQDQQHFMKSAANQGKKVILFTHHNPIDTLGTTSNALWTDVTGSLGLGTPPYMWYWGHVHNGMVYSENNKAIGNQTIARCLGNAAIPIGEAKWFEGNSNMDYFTNTLLNDGTVNNKLRVKNGFAILTISADGIKEEWYDQSGDLCWHN